MTRCALLFLQLCALIYVVNAGKAASPLQMDQGKQVYSFIQRAEIEPSAQPSNQPSSQPSAEPSKPATVAVPSGEPSQPSGQPSAQPSGQPSSQPSAEPSKPAAVAVPSGQPSGEPSQPSASDVTEVPSSCPSSEPSALPSMAVTMSPTHHPTAAPSRHPTPHPSHRPTRFPTPHPKAGTTWWYSTQAYVMVSWHPDQEEEPDQGPEELAPSLDRAFYLSLQELLDWDSQGMSTEVVVGSKDIFSPVEGGSGSRFLRQTSEADEGDGGVLTTAQVAMDTALSFLQRRALQLLPTAGDKGRRLKQAQWDSFTLGVWTTADGSLSEVAAALGLLMTNQSILLDYMAEGEHTTVDQFILHEVTPGVTSTPPPGVDSPAHDSTSIVLIIFWTLVLFAVGLLGISLVKSRCGCGAKDNDPFTYKAPSESLFGKMGSRSQQRGMGRGHNQFGRLSEMELSGGGGSGGTSGNPMHSSDEDRYSY